MAKSDKIGILEQQQLDEEAEWWKERATGTPGTMGPKEALHWKRESETREYKKTIADLNREVSERVERALGKGIMIGAGAVAFFVVMLAFIVHMLQS